MKATEERKAQMREAYRKRYADPDYRKKVQAQNREWSRNNKQGNRRRSLEWRNRNIEKAKAIHKQWRQSEAGRRWYRARDHERRARNLKVTVNPQSIEEYIGSIRIKRRTKCYYCQKMIAGKRAHLDHIIPLSKGGPHSIENLCVSCPSCNQSKINKPLNEWMKLGQQILSL